MDLMKDSIKKNEEINKKLKENKINEE